MDTSLKWNELITSLAGMETYEDENDPILLESISWWNKLPYEDRMKSFMALSALLYQGEVVENSSYREIIYNTLKFGGEGYTNGMICKFMVLHNIIKEGLSKGG